MYLKFEQVASSAVVKSAASLVNFPANAMGAELQADTQAIRYTMDGVTAPTASSGMLLLTTDHPKYFTVEDLKRIKFVQSAGGAGKLNVHYTGARNI